MSVKRHTNAVSRGFSLLELLVVVAILALLSAIGIYNMEGAQGRAKTARAMADMRTLATGIESYAVDHNEYPPNLPLAAPGSGPADPPHHLPVTPPQITTPVAYLTSLPADPFRAGRNVYGLASANPLRVELLFYNYFRVVSPGEWMRDYIGGRYASLIAVDIPPEAAGLPGNIGAEIKYGRWFTWSCGPDLRNWDAGTDFLIPGDLASPLKEPFSPPYGYTFDVPYDPTNGSTSFGNIIGAQAGIHWNGSAPRPTKTPGDSATPAPPPSDSQPPSDDGNPPADGEPENTGGPGDPTDDPAGAKPPTGAAASIGGGAAEASSRATLDGGGPQGGGGSESSNSILKPAVTPGAFTPPDDAPKEPASEERIIAMMELLHSRVAATKLRAPRAPTPPSRYDGRFVSLGLVIFALLLLIAYIAFRLLRKGDEAVDPGDINDASIATFNNLGTVTELHLANHQITDEGLEHLGRAQALESLNLWGTQVTDGGLAAIASLPKLRELVLCDTPVTDAGVREISKLPALRELVLMGTKISDASVPVLSKMTDLALLNLRGTLVTPEGLLRLREALPNCDIKYAALAEEIAPGE